jgi:protein TonB
MFEDVINKLAAKRAARRASWLIGSTFAQALLAIAILYRARAVKVQEDPVVQVKFMKGAAAPVSRFSAPPPAVPKKPAKERAREPARPIPPMIQPKEVAAEVEHDLSEPEDIETGDPDEGVVGGAVGGEAGGASRAVVQAPAPLEFNESSMKRPVFISGPDLAYTRRALDRAIEGLMIVKCVVTVEGIVRDCHVLTGLPYMDDAVVDALQHRRYQPATLGGKPVEVKYVFRINLKLPR